MKTASRLTTERSSVMTTSFEASDAGSSSRRTTTKASVTTTGDDGEGPRLGDVDIRPPLDGDETFGR